MDTRIKLDPLAYALLLGVLGLQLYGSLLQPSANALIEASDASYREAVFNSAENKGVMHQVFRQNEIDRELLKAVLKACSR